MTIVLGINTFTPFVMHDTAATIVKDGKIVASIQEERMSGVKHDGKLPIDSIKECMRIAGVTGDQIDAIACSWTGMLKFDSKAVPRYLFHKTVLDKLKNMFGINGKVYFVNHHQSHAASAYYTSGMKDCTNLVIDGRGDNESTSVFRNMQLVKKFPIKNSLGFFYQAVTESLGFSQNDGEGKTMGLACYGQPVYFDKLVEDVPKLDLVSSGFTINAKDGKLFSTYRYNYTKNATHFRKLMGIDIDFNPQIEKTKESDKELWQKYANMAASAQKYLETKVLDVVKTYAEGKNICLSGGVFLNCKLNQRIRELGFNTFIHPAASDTGSQTGAALEICRQLNPTNFKPEKMEHVYYGSEYSDEEIETTIKEFGLKYERLSDAPGTAADLINRGNVVGWFQGRMEYGPRALGNRSVLADPTDSKMRDRINFFLKKRDWFMPFCPSMLDEAKEEYLINAEESPFMIMTFDVSKEKIKEIPAVVHVDGTVRPQTVKRDVNKKYWRLIKEFEKHKVPLVLNTSFNKHGLPMIRTPKDALNHLVWKCIDVLILGDFLVERKFVQ